MRSETSDSGISRRERERRRCRELIFAAAIELFGRRGYQKTSMKEIADRADMSVGKLYSFFAGKEEIYREILEKYMGEMHRRGDAACLRDDPPLVQFRRRVVAAVEHFREHLDFLMIYYNESPLLLEGAVRREIERNRLTAEQLLERAMERGEIRRMDPSMLSAALIGAIHEILHMLAERRDLDRFEEVPDIMDRLIIEPLRPKTALDRKESER